MKALKHGGSSGAAKTTATATDSTASSTTSTGVDLSFLRELVAEAPSLSITPYLDQLFGDSAQSGPASGGTSANALWANHTGFSPTVGSSQAEKYRNATDAEVDEMDPAVVRAELEREQAAKDDQSWVQPGGPRDLLDVAKERQAAANARHAAPGNQDGGHAWDILEYGPKGKYRRDIREGNISEHRGDDGYFDLNGGYKYMHDAQGNETGWTNCSTFTTDQVMADAGYNIDKRMTIEGTTASLSDFANNRKKATDADYNLRTLQGDLETPIFANNREYYDARKDDSALTHGLAGALVNAKDDNGVALGTYLPQVQGEETSEYHKADLNFIRPGDVLQTYQGDKPGGTGGHSVIISEVTLVNAETGETLTLSDTENADPQMYPGFTVSDVKYLSANGWNDQGQVLTDEPISVEDMYSKYDGLIATRPRYNDWGEIGFEEGEDGQFHEVEVDRDTLEKVAAGPPE